MSKSSWWAQSKIRSGERGKFPWHTKGEIFWKSWNLNERDKQKEKFGGLVIHLNGEHRYLELIPVADYNCRNHKYSFINKEHCFWRFGLIFLLVLRPTIDTHFGIWESVPGQSIRELFLKNKLNISIPHIFS